METTTAEIIDPHVANFAAVPRHVSENRLLGSLPINERHRLAPYLEPVSLKLRQVLVEFDARIEYVYFLDTAVTSTVVRTPNGETIEVGIMGAEGFVGLSLLYGVERSNATVLVQVPGRALRMRSDDFIRHVAQVAGPARDQLLRYANYFQVMVQQHAACNVAHSVEERMCRWILLTHDRAGGDVFELTHEYLSVMLGVRRATVTTIAHRLKEKGLIAYTRGRVAVTNRRWLEACSCECYRLINEQMARTFASHESLSARVGY
jgi:CRP-like cAMP-binding protein